MFRGGVCRHRQDQPHQATGSPGAGALEAAPTGDSRKGRPGQLRDLLPTAPPLEGLGDWGTSLEASFPPSHPQPHRAKGVPPQIRRLSRSSGAWPPTPTVEAAEPQAPRAKAAKAPSTGLSTHAPAHAGIQLPGALWPASPPVHPRGDAAPCFSEPESQQLCSCDHTLLSDLLKSGEKPRRNKRFFPGWGLGPQKPWSSRDRAALCTRADLGRGTRAGMRARPSARPGARPGCGEEAGGGVQDRAAGGVSALLPAALVYFPPPPPPTADRPPPPSSGEETEAPGGTALPASPPPAPQRLGEEVASRLQGSHSPGAAGRQRAPQQ